MSSHRVRRLVRLGAAATALVLVAGAAPASAESGFWTSTPSMLMAARDDVSIRPLISVGDTIDGYMFEAIPDGIAIDPRGRNTLDIYVNHELSLEPFPPTKVDFTNSLLSKLTLKRGNGKVLEGSYVIPSSANYQRFCSNFMAGPEQGLDRYVVFTNEEAVQTFNRETTPSFPLDGDPSDDEQAGVVVAYDVDAGTYQSIHRMGRHNHENSVALPGYDEIAILSGDDTFTSFPPVSQLYLYTAPDTDTIFDGGGTLWAFKADPGVNRSPATIPNPTPGLPDIVNPLAGDDYYDVDTDDVLTGEFIEVPNVVADGDQAALETWSQGNNVFDFHRIEDIAYDRTNPNVVYLADSGRASASVPTGETFASKNGRIWRMELDQEDPRIVTSLTILYDGEQFPIKTRDVIHQPDNLETTANSLLITEDPSSANQWAAGDPAGTPARVWRIDLDTGDAEVVLAVDQSAHPTANQGAWEASGVVDASQYFGPGAFLVTVQAHTIWVGDRIQSPYLPAGALQTREGGQLLLVRIDGA
jgi:hypothetical protein